MKLQSIITLVLTQFGMILDLSARDDSATSPLLPPRSNWRLQWDKKLDGELKAEEQPVSWTVDVCNNRIHVDGGRSVLSGEIVEGRFPLFTLRQDDAQGYIAIYTGRMTEYRVIIGTWFNTFGQSGDFKLTIED